MAIKYLKNAAIDKGKWDECIANSPNGLIYSTSVFLNNMATDWDALVMDDYDAVMPLPFRKKYGIHYVYPPAFSQQMGITSLQKTTQDVIDSFLINIPAKFRYVEMNLNTDNVFTSPVGKIRENYFLPLSDSFPALQKNFSRSSIRNNKKATDENITIKAGINSSEIIAIHRERFKDKVGANEDDYTRLQKLFAKLHLKNMLFTLGAYNSKNILIAGSIYFVYKNRITFIINGNNTDSLKNGATHLLMNETIKKYCGKEFILDFEGSDFPEFVRFYKQYGALVENYTMVKINNLPWPLSLFKK